MSTGFECEFVEVKPGRWYYVLQRADCPVGAWDWREHADAYGPFASFEEAERDLSRCHANPGGFGKQPYTDGFQPDEVLAGLIARARS